MHSSGYVAELLSMDVSEITFPLFWCQEGEGTHPCCRGNTSHLLSGSSAALPRLDSSVARQDREQKGARFFLMHDANVFAPSGAPSVF